MSDNTDVRGGLVNRLRGLACPAGLAWTGTTPESDHGHTDCFIIHRAADALEAAEARLRDLADELNRANRRWLDMRAELEAAEATIANLEHQLQQADELTTTAYGDAEAAEARSADLQTKLAAIDALHGPDHDDQRIADCRSCDAAWPCPTHRILHPEEGNRQEAQQ